MTRIKQAPAEEQWQAFLAWLPTDLRHAPGIDWTRLPAPVMAFCTGVVGESPDAAYLAVTAGAASGRISASSLLRLLRDLRALLTTMRTRCGMQRVSDLRREAPWDAYAQHIRETRSRSQQLAAYSAASTKHLPQYLNGIEEAGDAFTMQQYQLPTMPGGFLSRVGRANELNNASRARTHRTRDFLLPLYPLLGDLAVLRKQLAERLLSTFRLARQQALAGAALPLPFSYADTLPSLRGEGSRWEIRQRTLTLNFILWNRRSWALAHRDSFGEWAALEAQHARGVYAPARDEYFVQFDGPARDLFWFGDLVVEGLLGHLSAATKGVAAAERLGRARELGFLYGCATHLGGLLQSQSRWFAENALPGELLFEPEALYRGVLYGAALVTLAMESGFGRRELLQVSADRRASPGETELGGSRLHLLSDPGASPAEDRQLYEVGVEAKELLAQIERVLVQVHGGVPVVTATDRVRGLEELRPERYLFQWQGGVVDPDSLTVLGRFVLHGLRLPGGERLTGLTPDLLKESSPRERDLLLLRDALLAPLAPGLTPGTLATYRQNLLRYLRFAGSPEQACQPETLARWLASLSQERPGGKRLALASVDGMALPVRTAMVEAGRAGRLAPEVAASFGALKASPSGNPRPPAGRREGWPVRTVEPERAAPDGDDEKRATGP